MVLVLLSVLLVLLPLLYVWFGRVSGSGSGAGGVRVTHIYIYPVKSCAGISVQSAKYNRLGLEYDRNFYILWGHTHGHVTQREYPRMALIQPNIDSDDNTLTLSFPDKEDLVIPLRPSDADVELSKGVIWDSEMPILLYRDAAISTWLGEVLELPANRQVKMATITSVEEHARILNPKYMFTPQELNISAGFSDQYPFLLCSQSSTRALNEWTAGKREVDVRAFRPNLVVSGADAWAEDNWKKIRIGRTDAERANNAFFANQPCPRCIMPNVDPDTGKRDPSGEPLLSLRAHRQIMRTVPGAPQPPPDEAPEVFFGQHLLQCQVSGEMRVGDEIEVVELKHSLYSPRQPTQHEMDEYKATLKQQDKSS